MAEGIKAPSPWERLEAQLILGSAAFTAKLKRPCHGIPEVRREQRFLSRPGLGRIFREKALTGGREWNRAIVEAAVRHGYSQAAIATYLGLH